VKIVEKRSCNYYPLTTFEFCGEQKKKHVSACQPEGTRFAYLLLTVAWLQRTCCTDFYWETSARRWV